MLGTAGHVDHGKTSLVRALTGIDTDRLAVEKQRGITTELGFAHLAIGDRRIAVVDVPGHERFIKSMVAGATGLDLVVLVIAADEGVMPQTREHLAICQLLGVRRGVVALSKVDAIDDPAWLALVTADVRAALADTFLADAPIVPTAIARADTIAALRDAIASAIASLPPRTPTGVFRLPVDRAFTIKGFGTVVTGTMLGGEVAVGDELVAIPTQRRARVRGIEVHGRATPRAIAGLRVALNLGGITVEELARGDLLAHVDRVAASHILDVEVRAVAGAALPADRAKVLVHHAAAQVFATLAMIDPARGLAQLRVDARTPLGALPGDRFILRGFVPTRTHGTTIGGGRVIRVLAPRARRREREASAAFAAAERVGERVALEVRATAAAGATIDDLVRRVGVPAEVLAPELATAVAAGELAFDGARYVHAAIVAELERAIAAAVAAGASDGVSRATVRAGLPAALPIATFDRLVAGLARQGRAIERGELLAVPARAEVPLAPAEAALLAQLLAAGIEPPRPSELPKPALDRLVRLGRVVRIKPDLMMHADVVADVKARLLAHLDAHGTIDAAQWKALTGASRKFTIPLAEYFDAEKVTLRVGDLRRRR